MPLLGKKRHTPAPMRAGIRAFLSTPIGYNGKSVGYKGEEGNEPGPFDRQCQRPLMPGTGTGDAPGEYFSPFGNEAAKRIGILVVNFQLLDTKLANLFLEKYFALATPAIIAVPPVYLTV